MKDITENINRVVIQALLQEYIQATDTQKNKKAALE